VAKALKVKIPDISHEEILANHAWIEFNDSLVDIYTSGNFSDFCQFLKFASISVSITKPLIQYNNVFKWQNRN
jgi:hypothetical protein